MACQIDALQIDPRYKAAMAQFCSDPENEQVCRQICELPPEVLQEKLAQIEGELQDWTENGAPSELRQAVEKVNPEAAALATDFLNNEAPQVLANEQNLRGETVQEFAQGGLAQQGRWGDRELAHVAPGEVVVPKGVFAQNPGLREGLGRVMMNSGADPRYYTVGNPRNRINPRTGQPEYGFLGKALGGIVGFALGGPIGAGLGAAAGGVAVDGDSFGEAAMWGLGAYGIAGAGVGLGAWGSGYTGYGGGLGAYWTAPGSTALGGMFASEAVGTAGAVSGLTGLEAGNVVGAESLLKAGITPEMMAADKLSLVAGIDPGTFNVVSSTTGQATIPSLTGMAPEAAQTLANATTASTTTPSFLDKTWGWVKENPLPAALIGTTALGAMEEPQLPREPSGAEYFNEYDAYTDCLAAGGTQEECQAAHPKGWAEIAPPPQSQWLAGTGDITGAPGTAGTPSGTMPMTSQPWYQQMSQFGYADGGYIKGAGSETSDSIPARLSNNEFVLTADAVRGAGNGSVKRGARKLYDLMDRLERRAKNG